MPQPRSMFSALADWGDLTGEKEKNAQHNAREARIARERREGGEVKEGGGKNTSRTYRRSSSGAPAMFGTLASPDDQYRMSQGMANQTMDAIQRENDSRVAQRREMRRLGADYEMERLRQMGANQRAQIDAEASLIRQLLADM